MDRQWKHLLYIDPVLEKHPIIPLMPQQTEAQIPAHLSVVADSRDAQRQQHTFQCADLMTLG